ncbi:MAG: hypothetical protein ACSHYA_08945 [Opitutaceae bacterium]
MKQSSNMRTIAVVFATRYYSPNATYQYENLKTIEDFLTLMAKMDLRDSDVFFNQLELSEFKDDPPKWIGDSVRDRNPPRIDKDLLDFPIGYTIAVYSDLDGSTSQTPLLWTRGLHQYAQFDKPFGGHVVYMDGHVTHFHGDQGGVDPKLEELFGENGIVHKAARLIEHVPENWNTEVPLPVRLEQQKRTNHFKEILVWFSPAILGGLLATIFSREPLFYQKLIRGALVATIIFVLTAVLTPSVC